MSGQELSVAEVFRRYGESYRQRFASHMSQDQLKAMWAIERCRTGRLGTAVYHCSKCGTSHGVPRSCGNRHCPTCQADKAQQWLQAQLARLLPCPYFLVTFTVPEEIRSFVRSHPRQCYAAMFDAASATLKELAADPKYIGSDRLGMTAVLHTWGRDCCYHPHVHIIVPGGALSDDGSEWLPGRADFLVSVRAASVLYRAKFKEAMRRSGLLAKVPPSAWKRSWIVHSQAVGDGRSALKYLAPYVFRVAISDRRIRAIEDGPDAQGQVTFTYRKSGSKRSRSMTVSADEFIRRFLQHVLPSGFRKVRHYGFAASPKRTDFELLGWIVTLSLSLVYSLTVGASQPARERGLCCRECGEPMRLVAFLLPMGDYCDTS